MPRATCQRTPNTTLLVNARRSLKAVLRSWRSEATVEIEEIESGERLTYQIVGDVEADIRASKISVSSPVARALIGKSEGDVVEVQAPGGTREYEIISISYV